MIKPKIFPKNDQIHANQQPFKRDTEIHRNSRFAMTKTTLFDESRGTHLVDAAAAVTAVNTVVSLFAPVHAPRVFDRPVRRRAKYTIVHTVANDKHAVVEASKCRSTKGEERRDDNR